MIRYIKGRPAMVGENTVILDNQGIGYRIFVPGTVRERLAGKKEEITFYTYLNVREDAMQLFGFLQLEELELFEKLITVSGIGPKAALGILSAMSVSELQYAVLAEDAKSISRAPGIGPKTAKKLIVELKDKIDPTELIAGEETLSASQGGGSASSGGVAAREAVEALEALGYTGAEAYRVVSGLSGTEELTTEEILTMALKKL